MGSNASLRRKKVRRKHLKVCKSSFRQIKLQVVFIQIILRNLLEFVKMCVGIKTRKPHTLQNTKKTKTNMDKQEENIINDLWNIDEHRTLRKLERIHEIPNPQQTTTPWLLVGLKAD